MQFALYKFLFFIYFILIIDAANLGEKNKKNENSFKINDRKIKNEENNEIEVNSVTTKRASEAQSIKNENSGDDDGDSAIEVVSIDEIEDDASSGFYTFQGPQLPDCSAKNNDGKPLLLVSTLDGYISGLDYVGGEVLWSHQTSRDHKPMLASSMSSMELTSHGDWVRYVPSLDGQIFRLDADGVEAVPLSADSLLRSSIKFNEDVIFAGDKSSSIVGLVPHTGEIQYWCDKDGCPPRPAARGPHNEVLVVRRTSHTVRAVDPRTGGERWNFSVGEHDLNLNPLGCGSSSQGSTFLPPTLRFILAQGLVEASRTSVIWKQKLPSPIVSAWSLVGGQLRQLDLFSSTPSLVPAERQDDLDEEDSFSENQGPASLYVGIHGPHLYIQTSSSFKRHLREAMHTKTGSEPSPRLPRVKWSPYLPQLESYGKLGSNRRPLLDTHASITPDFNESPSSVGQVDHTYDDGYYLFGDSDTSFSNESDPGAEEPWGEDTTYKETDDLASQMYYVCFEATPSLWAKGLICACAYGLLHAFVVRAFVRRSVRRAREAIERRAADFFVIVLHNIFREHPQVLAIIQRLGLNVPPLPSPPTRPLEEQNNSSNTTFTSRFCSDFESVCGLGRGGFGVVLRVRNKLDQEEYAIKRIKMPINASSSDRVKREVRALAKLNHPGIVRYYNSWVETPPPGWREEEIFKGDSISELSCKCAASAGPLSNPLSGELECPWHLADPIQGIAGSTFDRKKWSVESSAGSLSSSSTPSPPPCLSEDDDSFQVVFKDSAEELSKDVQNKKFEWPQESEKGLSTTTSISIGKIKAKTKNYRRRRRRITDTNSARDLVEVPQGVCAASYLYIQMELCRVDTLSDWLSCSPHRDEKRVLKAFNDIVHAVEYVHDRQLMHRDLKPSNIFFSLSGEIKIGDFGLATDIGTEEPVSPDETDSVSLPEKDLLQRTRKAGTHLYMSPEQLRNEHYDYKVDIFSLGLILLEMLQPFGTQMERREALQSARERHYPQGFREKFKDVATLLDQTLHPSPSLRPTTRGLRSLPPLRVLQRDSHHITPEEHFFLRRNHITSSGSSSGSLPSP